MAEAKEKLLCGLVMPISEIDGCDANHWSDVKRILGTAITNAGFDYKLVSDEDEVGVIHKRIIQNLYNNPVVVCDVSCRNPNVMFELGLRLAFDKPTIIIKDDKTNYMFDTSSIEHLEYPRDLRHGRIEEFQKKLKEKIEFTHKKKVEDPSYSTFLKHFGEYKVSGLEQTEITSQEQIIEEISSLKRMVARSHSIMVENEIAKAQQAKAQGHVYVPTPALGSRSLPGTIDSLFGIGTDRMAELERNSVAHSLTIADAKLRNKKPPQEIQKPKK